MLKLKPQRPDILSEDFSIVLVGDFNPKIFQPAWFAHQGLVRESEAEAATLELIHSDFTSFSTDWFVMQVARERFTVTVKSVAYRQHLKDLVLGTFTKLSHTPVTQMGINANTRLNFRTTENWHAFGHFIVPKANWAKALGTLGRVGTRTVTVETPRYDERPGRFIVIAEPVQGAANEVLIRINDHFDVPKDAPEGAGYFMEVVSECYDNVLGQAKTVRERLIEAFLEQETFDDGNMQ